MLIRKRILGFTIVELIVVISILGILTTIGIISYGAWRDLTAQNAIKSDLVTAAQAMESERNFGVGYSTSLPSSFTPSDEVTVVWTSGDATFFCLDGSSATTSATFYIYSATLEQGAIEGSCVDRPDLTPPQTPTGLSIQAVTLNSLSLDWTSVTEAESYDAQCATDTAFIQNVHHLTTTHPTVTGLINNLTAATTFYCRVKAVNSKGSSDWSATVTTNTNTPTPMNLVASTVSSTQINYSWAAVPTATSYTLEYSVSPTFSVGVASVTGQFRDGTINNLTPNTYYYLRVKATGADGDSPYSTIVSTPTTRVNWTNFTKMVSVGDWDNDGKNDIIAYRPNGDLFMHRNLSTSSANLSFESGRYLGNAGTAVRNVVPIGRLPSTVTPAILIAHTDGTGTMFVSNGGTGANAPITSNVPSGQGNWAQGDSVYSLPRLYTDNRPTAVIKSSAYIVWTFNGSGVTSLVGSYGNSWSAAFPGDRVFGPGDWNSDGYGDVIGINTSGNMSLYLGNGTGNTASVIAFSTGWFNDWVFGGYDIDGDNKPDILRYYYPSNALCLYTGNGSTGFSAGSNCSLVIQ